MNDTRGKTLLDAFGTASGAFATTEMLGLMLALRSRKDVHASRHSGKIAAPDGYRRPKR